MLRRHRHRVRLVWRAGGRGEWHLGRAGRRSVGRSFLWWCKWFKWCSSAAGLVLKACLGCKLSNHGTTPQVLWLCSSIWASGIGGDMTKLVCFAKAAKHRSCFCSNASPIPALPKMLQNGPILSASFGIPAVHVISSMVFRACLKSSTLI